MALLFSAQALLCFLAQGLQAEAKEKPGRDLIGTTLRGKVVGVHDGDSLSLLVGQRTYKLRLEGIDAPELGQDYGRAAKRFLGDLAVNQSIEARVSDIDRYSRVVARIWLGKLDLCRLMVSSGYAWHYAQYSSDPGLRLAEREARAGSRGLWAAENGRAPIAPWEYRKSRRKK